MAPMLGSGSLWLITAFLCLELFLMGCTFAPMGALLPELFPTAVRYTGAGAAYNLGGILGASLAPYLAQQLVLHGGLAWVGGYISVAAAISVLAATGTQRNAEPGLGMNYKLRHSRCHFPGLPSSELPLGCRPESR